MLTSAVGEFAWMKFFARFVILFKLETSWTGTTNTISIADVTDMGTTAFGFPLAWMNWFACFVVW